MSLEFLVASDVERDSISLEVYRPAFHQVMNIEETADREYVVEFWTKDQEVTFPVQETALILARALRFAGLNVRPPDG